MSSNPFDPMGICNFSTVGVIGVLICNGSVFGVWPDQLTVHCSYYGFDGLIFGVFKHYYLNLVVVFNFFSSIFHVITRGRVLFSEAYLHSWRVFVVRSD
jgi:hypothetical protein